MKRFLILFLALASSCLAQGTLPCGNYVDQSEPSDPNSTGNSTLKFFLPHGSGHNNTIIGGIMGASGNTYTITDDKSLTWNTSTQTDSVNGQIVTVFWATVSTASTNPAITISENATDETLAAWAMECKDTWTLDKQGGARGTTNSVAAGSLAPTASGDLVVQAGWNDNAATPSVSAVTAGTNFTLVAADRAMYGFSGQAQLYNSPSALNATYTISATNTGFVTRVVFFSNTATGTAFPAGVSVNCQKTFWINSANFLSGASAGLPRTEQWACPSSNGIASTTAIFPWIGGSTGVLSGASDGSSETFNLTGAAVCNGGGGCTRTAYYCGATVNSTQTVTVTGTSSGADSGKFYGVSGLATSSNSACFDKTTTHTGNSASTSSVDAGSITPATSNGLVLGTLSVSANVMGAVSGAGQLFLGCFWGNQSLLGNGGCDEDNGWAYYLNPNTTAVDFTYTTKGSTTIGNWSFRGDAFEAPTGPPRNQFSRIQ